MISVMSTILSRILTHKAQEVALQRQKVPLKELERQLLDAPAPRSMRKSLANSASGIIAEFKRKSPSKGWIFQDATPETIVPTYDAGGASALSVLTDEAFFGGSLDFLRRARSLTELPLLRKEFIIDEYQLLEARATGADAILLIAAALPNERLQHLAREAKGLGLEVLLEVHTAEELSAYCPEVDMVGINNRDLHSFQTDAERSVRLFDFLPKEALPVSESGLLNPCVAQHLHQVGFRGFLIGEAFMREEDPGEALQRYIAQMTATL